MMLFSFTICLFFSESAEQGRHSVSSCPPLDKVTMIKKQFQELNQQRYGVVEVILNLIHQFFYVTPFALSS